MDKITILKYLTSENIGCVNLSSQDALDILSFAVKNVLRLSEEEILRVFCNGFLKKHNLYKYYIQINPPSIFSEHKQEWVKMQLCPTLFRFNHDEAFNEMFFNTLREDSKKTLFERFHSIPFEEKAGRSVLNILFKDVKSPNEYLYFASTHPAEMKIIIKSFKLYDFYDIFCFSPVDFVFFCLSREEQKETISLYLKIKENQKDPDVNIIRQAKTLI